MADKRVFKSTRKVSSVRALYRKWAEWDTGDVLIGTYKGSQTDSYDKPNWLVEIIDAQFGDKKAAKKFPEGEIIGLNSSGKLDKAMESVEVGEMIQVTYNGTSTIEKGKYKGKEAHDIEVDVVEEDDGDDTSDGEPDEDEDENEDVDL